MSSLTSPSVNKNITRFTPKVKQREHRSSLKSTHLPTTELAAISASSSTDQLLASSTSSTTQSNEATSSIPSLPATDSPQQSSPSKSPPLNSSTSKPTPSISASKPYPRRLSSTPSNAFQPPSKGDHIVFAPPTPDQDTPANFSPTDPELPDITTTTTTATAATPILHDNNSTTVDLQYHQPQPRRYKRKLSLSSINPKIAPQYAESLTTLDDITHDPGEPSLLQKPLSYFTNDLVTGVVSRSFKDSERRKAAAVDKSQPTTKKVVNNVTPVDSMEILDNADNLDDESKLKDSPSAPQVRLVDGEIVLDTSSLYIEKPLGQRQPVDYEVVEEDNTSKRINSQTYGKRNVKYGKRWTKDETNLFYQGLTQYGTDFEMIATMIPKRTRREIKLMFNRQEKVCPWKITASIMRKPAAPQEESQEQTRE